MLSAIPSPPMVNIGRQKQAEMMDITKNATMLLKIRLGLKRLKNTKKNVLTFYKSQANFSSCRSIIFAEFVPFFAVAAVLKFYSTALENMITNVKK